MAPGDMTRRIGVGGHEFTAVRTVGGALPADILTRVVDPKGGLLGLTADDYELELGVTPVEAANRAWSVLTGAWSGYRAALERLPDGDRATSLTRDKWLLVLLRELGFGRVPTSPAGGIATGERSFPISHQDGAVPIHLLGRGVPLDTKTPGLAGAAERAPHAMVQELLNRSDDHLWAILANDTTLRLLRDSSTLVGQSYVEFDLGAIFDGELFADFTVLFLLSSHSRFQPTEDAGLAGCWLERWRTYAAETGARALGALRDGVKDAIEALGTGFLRHPANTDLRDRLAAGSVELADVHRSLLRLVYRLLFVFVAEDRGLLLDPAAPEVAKARYRDWFSSARLRHVARHRRGTRHDDHWQALRLVLDGLGDEAGRPELALPALGGIFENGPVDVTATAALANEHLLAAVRHLSVIQPPGGGPRRVVDYRNLGAEELGGIYESLLEFVPRHDPAERAFTLETLAGNDRKTSGAYYTPSSLIDCLLDSALDPILDRAERDPDPEAALLALTVCDPACGSGHFLVAAAKRLAHRVARVRAEGGEPTVDQSQAAMHDVAARCIYGVDLNPMAAELAKVSLWLESLAAGRPLGFLDAHIKIGDALLGGTPALLAAGIPDEAFVALEGDDKKTVTALKKQNKAERAGQGSLFGARALAVDTGALTRAACDIEGLPSLSLADIHLAQQRQRELESSSELRRARLVADAWCASFVAMKRPEQSPITHEILRRWSADRTIAATSAEAIVVERLSAEFRFFHWHIEFPQVFSHDGRTDSGLVGGFSCVIGNPPWERIKLQDEEFFAAARPDIASATNAAARRVLIARIEGDDPGLHRAYLRARRKAEAKSHLIRKSQIFPLCGRGDVNTYALFAERFLELLGPRGRMGVVVPSGIATDESTSAYFGHLIKGRQLASFYDFINDAGLFKDVGHGNIKFCLLTVGRERTDAPRFSFYRRLPAELSLAENVIQLSSEDIALMNPNTLTVPIFRTTVDATLVRGIYDRLPILIDETTSTNLWDIKYLRMFDMSGDSALFRRPPPSERELPLYEGKMINLWDHRWGEDAQRLGANTGSEVVGGTRTDPFNDGPCRYVLETAELPKRLAVDHEWLFGFRDVCRSIDNRTFICSVFPRRPAGHKLPVLLRRYPGQTNDHSHFSSLVAMMSSMPFDYVVRQKHNGASLTLFVLRQLPVLPPSAFEEIPAWTGGVSIHHWLVLRVAELAYTSWSMDAFGAFLGDTGPPFVWADERRVVIQAEVDAAFFLLFGLDRPAVDHILDSFNGLNRTEEAQLKERRTLRHVTEQFDRLSLAAERRTPFESCLVPGPGAGPRHPDRRVR